MTTINSMMGAQQQAPLMDSQSLSPQQKLAIALMQNSQQQANPSGAWSPMQGANSLFQSYLAGQMMNRGQGGQLGNNVSPYAMQNANSSQDPLGTLIQTQGWTDPSPQ